MKQPPHLDRAQARMAPGVLTMDGFLGTDGRDLIEVLEDDDGTVRRLGLTHRGIAEAMQRLTDLAVNAFGGLVDADPFEICACEGMGGLPCPFGHAGLYPKTVIEARRTDTSQRLQWTALEVHLIGEHGFYQGRGSPFRLEPPLLAQFLGLSAEEEEMGGR